MLTAQVKRVVNLFSSICYRNVLMPPLGRFSCAACVAFCSFAGVVVYCASAAAQAAIENSPSPGSPWPTPNTTADIWIEDLETHALIRVTNDALVESRPSWSPAEDKLVFGAVEFNKDKDWPSVIVFYTLEDQKREIFLAGSGKDYDPDWSPDGNRVAFISRRDGSVKLFTAKIDGSELRCLVDVEGHFCFHPRWSPDGQRIAFGMSTAIDNEHLYLIRADGTDLQNISLESLWGFAYPAWSRDGRYLAVSTSHKGLWIRDMKDAQATPQAHPMPTHLVEDPFGGDFSTDGSFFFMAQKDDSPELQSTGIAELLVASPRNSRDEMYIPRMALTCSPSGRKMAILNAKDIFLTVTRIDSTLLSNEFMRPYRTRQASLGMVVLGMHGELLGPFRMNESVPESDLLYVFSENNELHLSKTTHTESGREDYLIVRKNGIIESTEIAKKEFDLSLLPRAGPDLDKNGIPICDVSRRPRVMFSGPAVSISERAEAEQWMIPSACGALFFPSQQTPRPPQTVYFREESGQIQLIDSATEDLMAEVTNGGQVRIHKYPQWFRGHHAYPPGTLYWPYKNMPEFTPALPIEDDFLLVSPRDDLTVPIE